MAHWLRAQGPYLIQLCALAVGKLPFPKEQSLVGTVVFAFGIALFRPSANNIPLPRCRGGKLFIMKLHGRFAEGGRRARCWAHGVIVSGTSL
jgi:hypothetical protein